MQIDYQWKIKDGDINEKILKTIKGTRGEYSLIFKKYKKSRTDRQNRALHLYFSLLSEALNKDGFDMRAVIKEDIDIYWTPQNIKEYLWRPVQKQLFNKRSTTELTTDELDKIYEIINKVIGERAGIYIPWPSIENLMVEEEELDSQ